MSKDLPQPPLPALRIGQLDTLKAVRRELARVYKDARRGALDTADASRLCFLLVSLARLIEGDEHEARIARLETWIAQQRQKA